MSVAHSPELRGTPIRLGLEEARACLNHLLSAVVEDDDRQVSIPRLIREACGVIGDDQFRAQWILRLHGLKVVKMQERWVLAVGHRSSGLQQLFLGTRWAISMVGDPRWPRALRHLSAVKGLRNRFRFPGSNTRANLIPLEEVDSAFNARTGRFEI